MTIGNRITALRKELQMSQEEMADRIGVSRQAVSKWETDASAPDAFNLISLAEVLQTSVEYIVTGKTPAVGSDTKTVTAPEAEEKAPRRSNLSILGFILVAGGILMGIIAMFIDATWAIIGGFVAAAGLICAVVKKKKALAIAFAIWAVLAVAVVLLLTL